MVSSIIIQNEYQKLYTQVRRYLWSFDTVEMLAELEIACYQAFPSLDDVKVKFSKFKREIAEKANEDAELKEAITDFEDVINSESTLYLTLNKVREVVSV